MARCWAFVTCLHRGLRFSVGSTFSNPLLTCPLLILNRRALAALIRKAGQEPSSRVQKKVEIATVALALVIREYEASLRPLVPGLLSSQDPASLHPAPHLVSLRMPSSLSVAERLMYYRPELVDLESKLRGAFADELLEELRRHIRIRTTFVAYKIANVRGVKNITRSLESMRLLQGRIDTAADDYRACRAALMVLRGPGEWEDELKVLHQADV
jgi:hypothetical protein